ncbi:hypothetical protein DBR32_13830 [Taibaiella sp. KBW10]|nr:hypothetical protein DBR32_13830 [Taibaiella sp. KBW10]
MSDKIIFQLRISDKSTKNKTILSISGYFPEELYFCSRYAVLIRGQPEHIIGSLGSLLFHRPAVFRN